MSGTVARHARRVPTDRGNAGRPALRLLLGDGAVLVVVLALVLAVVTHLHRAEWAAPTAGELTSAFGWRIHPVTGVGGLHAGQDVSNDCGTPVLAAADGTVAYAAAGPYQGRTGNQILIDHGDGVATRYGHLLTGTMVVAPGDRVTAGSQIAQMGGDPALDPVGAGDSTGCHLHVEVLLDGVPVDPVDFLADHGVTISSDP